MKVIYALFGRYADARGAVKELLDQGYNDDEMNVIVQADIAHEHMDLDFSSVGVEVTDEVGTRTSRGLDPFLAAHTPVPVPGLGEVYAAGDLATMLVKAAMVHGAGADGLQSALKDFVPLDVAQAFAGGISRGGLLFWIRTGDERGGIAAQTLRRYHGQYVDDYVG